MDRYRTHATCSLHTKLCRKIVLLITQPTTYSRRVLEQHRSPATALQSCYTHTHTLTHGWTDLCIELPDAISFASTTVGGG